MFKDQLTDREIISYVAQVSGDEEEFLEERYVNHLKRHQIYNLRRVALEDIHFRNEGYHPSRVQEYVAMDSSKSPPVVLDGVFMLPWDGIHRLNAARARGETHVWAYVGSHPRHDRVYDLVWPALSRAWEAGDGLHKALSVLMSWRTKHIPGWSPPTAESLVEMASQAEPEYMTEQGSSLLGIAVEAWIGKPASLDLEPVVSELLRRGASPDRTYRSAQMGWSVTPFNYLLSQHHPSPLVLDPETPLPDRSWDLFKDCVDLGLKKNQTQVRAWLEKAGDRPLQGAALHLEAALSEAGLSVGLPAPSLARFSPRF